jgi:hypothetical protein
MSQNNKQHGAPDGVRNLWLTAALRHCADLQSTSCAYCLRWN